MKAGESMRRNFAQILKDAKIDIKVEYQKLYGMLYDRSIQVSNTNRISVYDELSTFFIAFHFSTCFNTYFGTYSSHILIHILVYISSHIFCFISSIFL